MKRAVRSCLFARSAQQISVITKTNTTHKAPLSSDNGINLHVSAGGGPDEKVQVKMRGRGWGG